MQPDRPRLKRTGAYAVVAVLITAAIVAPLIVPLYARRTPELFGFPFFFWSQIGWVFVDALLVWICFKILTAQRSGSGAQETRR